MSATGRYVKPARKLILPSVAFAVVCRVRTDHGFAVHNVDTDRWTGANVSVSYRRRGKWSEIKSQSVETPEELRAWMCLHARERATNWVITPSLPDTLTLSQWWSYADATGVDFAVRSDGRAPKRDRPESEARLRVSQFCPSDAPGILTYSADGIRWRWVGERNYWPDGINSARDDSGDSRSGIGRHRGRVQVDGGRAVCESCALLSRFRGLCEWYGRIATAPLGHTASACAWGVLRSYVAPKCLCTHGHDDAHRLERSSAFGGRASVWYANRIGCPDRIPLCDPDGYLSRAEGNVRGPITHVDVTSMYPWLLATRLYPIRRAVYYGEMRPADVIELARGVGVIARVTILARDGEYPRREREYTTYPVGTFTSTLAGPEILTLGERNELIQVHECSTYVLGNPFRAAMEVLLKCRAESAPGDDGGFGALSKLLANSLGGRLARKPANWSRCEALDEPGKWGEERSVSVTTGLVTRYRWIAGRCEVWVPDRYPRGPHTSAFAYMTSYGRCHMRRLRELCPPRSVVSQDTDGLYLLPEGIRALTEAGMLAGKGAGSLRVTGARDSGQWWGPRHYLWGEDWTLAGMGGADPTTEPGMVSYLSRSPFLSGRMDGPPTEVTRLRLTVPLPSELERGRVCPDGWILPPLARTREGPKKRSDSR